MSLTAAFNSALSGLQAFGKESEVISSNVANATTPGYGQRNVEMAANTTGPGVTVTGVTRNSDPGVVAARRSTEAQSAEMDAIAEFRAGFADAVGTPDEAGSISALSAEFEASLVEAASAPEAPARLDAVVIAANDLTEGINRAADDLSEARSAADRAIADQVETLNTRLSDVETLNAQITATQARGGETAGLIDQRQIAIDDINRMVPVREVARPNGQVALFTEGGAILLDGKAAELGFTATGTVTPHQSLDAGTLSGLTLNGREIDTSSDKGALRGGTLSAQFAIRDEEAVEAQQELDAVARDVITRLQSSDVDPSLAPGDAGLFTDAGAAFDPANEAGIANRISVNAAVDPNAGGETWRLRSGMQAASPGPVGDATLLNNMRDALSASAPVASGGFGPGEQTTESLISQLTSWAGSQSDTAAERQSFLAASYSEMLEAELALGVDTDAELQNLMLVEDAYSANARVLQAVDEMMQEILRI